MTTPQEDLLDIIDDVGQAPAAPKRPGVRPWHILIADDDPEVHSATVFALADVSIDGRPLLIIHAYSAQEALAAIVADSDIAAVLLDVVMEREDAGLELVHKIRHDLCRDAIRIILRTGQPGYAPEAHVIREYDINDYKTKSELTRVRLLTTLTTALRSYGQLCAIMAARRNLAHVVDTAADLLSRRDPCEFAAAALAAISKLAGEGSSAFLAVQSLRPGKPATADNFYVIGSSNDLSACLDLPLSACGAPGELAAQAASARRNLGNSGAAVFFIAGEKTHDAVLYLCTPHELSAETRQIIEVFCINVGIGLENVNLIADLSFSAYNDHLTHLANRSGFIARIDDHLHAEKGGWSVALIDIDHFSELNDALGHHKGDELLRSVARRLCSMLKPGMVLARVGGDVFGLLGPDEELDPRLLLDHFRLPFCVDGYSLPIKATVGITRLDQVSESDGIDILKATNIALNRAKNGDRGRWHYYTADMARETRSRLDRLHDLRLAVASGQGLELHYQPQVDMRNGRLLGAEALIRWRGPDGQFIRPDLFISLAEYSGLIIELGAWVLKTAIAELGRWQKNGVGSGVNMAINISLVQFRDPAFIDRVRDILDETGVSPELIELEITESVAMLEAESVISTLGQLKALGIKVAIDDFGTGFSSLAYLHRLPIDRLKIDRAFVRDLDMPGGSGVRIAQAVISLGRSLGLSVIAEGVETQQQGEILQKLGCELAQGFFYARPMDSASFLAWTQQRA